MSVFTLSELEYVRGGGARRLARIATVGSDGTPHVVPVGFRYEPAHDSIDVGGHELERTKKYRAWSGPDAPRSSSTTSRAPIRGALAASRCAVARRRSRRRGR
jgi:nitroimidazol reductase NimA-like FMN-containing flavoprotein (pyridoxamine 5'-phosphate oxidase superfamily)